MNLPELGPRRFYAPLLAVFELGHSHDSAGTASAPLVLEPLNDDFEETRPMWFVSGIEEDAAMDEGIV